MRYVGGSGSTGHVPRGYIRDVYCIDVRLANAAKNVVRGRLGAVDKQRSMELHGGNGFRCFSTPLHGVCTSGFTPEFCIRKRYYVLSLELPHLVFPATGMYLPLTNTPAWCPMCPFRLDRKTTPTSGI